MLGVLLLAGVACHAAGASVVIYDNATENGFDPSCSSGGSASDIDFANDSPAYDAPYSIRFTPDDLNAVGWCAPAAYSALDDHSGIAFWVYLSDAGEGSTTNLVLANAGAAVASQDLQALYGGPLPTNEWVPIQASFVAPPMNYTGAYDEVLFQDASGTIEANLYLDELSLLPAERVFGGSFEPAATQYTVSAEPSGGHGSITPASQMVDAQGTATFQVTADVGYDMAVGGDHCIATRIGSSATWVSSAITQDCSVLANFSVQTFHLTLGTNGNGLGMVTPSPVGTSCGTGCYVYDYGTMVSITASPSPISTFTTFSGGGCATTNPCSVQMTAPASVTATFNLQRHQLHLYSNGGNGSGTLTPFPVGSDCGTDCYVYDYGTNVTVIASASTGSTFSQFVGDGCSSANPCHLTVTFDSSVTGSFTLNKFNITLATDGGGAGMVMPSPVGTSCGANCYTYNYNTPLQITATPADGSSFTTFSGGGCTTTNPCWTNVIGAATITAFFSSP
jgi:hypothetical protein